MKITIELSCTEIEEMEKDGTVLVWSTEGLPFRLSRVNEMANELHVACPNYPMCASQGCGRHKWADNDVPGWRD